MENGIISYQKSLEKVLILIIMEDTHGDPWRLKSLL